MEAPLALYRRYRPETYAEVIGQDHVTEPLRQALRNNRVNHAYLFSGPRGCGKTTSARILARCLNCEQGPTPDPCGVCQSCRDLARGGPGSIDVIEIDAASHGGVDDARDLRERAFFAPVSARYKIYIVDEAHMVTTQGFNALLKLVEEPPEHLKFVFATTEPDKVIGTIRSRTHHYPFRLVPPKLLQDYLAELCTREGVKIDAEALPLVVRAGGGSVRDTLSVLDQLMGAAAGGAVTYDQAVSLLGYTPDSLLDEVVDALAARDGGAVFSVIDKVIESGQDPKRFGEDLLRRLRDLVIVAAVPDAAERHLIEGPPEQLERLGERAARFGAAELTRAADIVHAGLLEMRGATAPRIQLELMCARVLLPATDDSEQGVYARLERLERQLAGQGVPPAQAMPTAPATPPAAASPAEATPPAAASTPPPVASPTATPPTPTSAVGPQTSPEEPAQPPTSRATPTTDGWDTPAAARPSEARPAPDASASAAAPSAPQPQAGGSELVTVRQRWPEILEAVMRKRRFTWILLSQNAQVIGVSGNVLTIGLVNAGARDSFMRGGSEEILRTALHEVLGGEWRIEAVIDPSGGAGGGPSGRGGGPSGGASGPGHSGGPGQGGPRSGGAPGGGQAPSARSGRAADSSSTTSSPPPSSSHSSSAPGSSASGSSTSASSADDGWPPPARPPGSPAGSPATSRRPHDGSSDPAGSGSVPSSPPPDEISESDLPPGDHAPDDRAWSDRPAPASEAARPRGARRPADFDDAARSRAAEPVGNPDDDVDPETDAALAESTESQTELLRREFGAQIIAELPHG